MKHVYKKPKISLILSFSVSRVHITRTRCDLAEKKKLHFFANFSKSCFCTSHSSFRLPYLANDFRTLLKHDIEN